MSTVTPRRADTFEASSSRRALFWLEVVDVVSATVFFFFYFFYFLSLLSLKKNRERFKLWIDGDIIGR